MKVLLSVKNKKGRIVSVKCESSPNAVRQLLKSSFKKLCEFQKTKKKGFVPCLYFLIYTAFDVSESFD